MLMKLSLRNVNSFTFSTCVPPKLVNFVKALHETFTVKIDNEPITEPINNSIGVKQGVVLGPMLFTFFITATNMFCHTMCMYS